MLVTFWKGAASGVIARTNGVALDRKTEADCLEAGCRRAGARPPRRGRLGLRVHREIADAESEFFRRL